MTICMKFEILSLKDKNLRARVFGGESIGLATNLRLFWVQFIKDSMKGDWEQSEMFNDISKLFENNNYFHYVYDKQAEKEEAKTGSLITWWKIEDIIRLNDQGFQEQNEEEGYWNSQAIYEVEFAKSSYISHLKEGGIYGTC